jgi:hypothetical protein
MAEDIQAQLGQLQSRLQNLTETAVSRKEFEELRLLVRKLAARLDDIAPEGEIPTEHLAIMSAVFAATIGKKFRIKNVRRVVNESGWAQAGRVHLHAQRHVRRP